MFSAFDQDHADVPNVQSERSKGGIWKRVPKSKRSIVRAYINSENERDIERAHELCEHYDLDYDTMRQIIRDEMIEESRALGKAWTPAAGSRPLSPERP